MANVAVVQVFVFGSASQTIVAALGYEVAVSYALIVAQAKAKGVLCYLVVVVAVAAYVALFVEQFAIDAFEPSVQGVGVV